MASKKVHTNMYDYKNNYMSEILSAEKHKELTRKQGLNLIGPVLGGTSEFVK